jgi:hypothetical protein
MASRNKENRVNGARLAMTNSLRLSRIDRVGSDKAAQGEAGTGDELRRSVHPFIGGNK